MKIWKTAYKPAIEKFHHNSEIKKFDFEDSPSKLKCPKLTSDEDLYVMSSRIRFSRNLEGYPFSMNSNDVSREKIRTLVKKAYEKLPPIPQTEDFYDEYFWNDAETI